MKIPRDCTGADLVRALRRLGYAMSRQAGSHMVLTTQVKGEHHVTVPAHKPIKVGTLHDILKSVARHHECTLDQVIRDLEL